MSHSRASFAYAIRLAAVADEAAEPSELVEARWTSLSAVMAQAVRRQCPTWLSDYAQDIAQAALMKVMALARQCEGERPLTSFYLHRIAHSALVDEIRRRRRRGEVALDVVTDGGEDHRPFEPRAQRDPEQDASFRQLGAAVRCCLVAMKRERRLAVILYLQGHSVPEAARILGWSVKRTENLVYRGLADLRARLAERGYRP
jgi:RNA polymerase sigma-70 factor (ECF subfamily)